MAGHSLETFTHRGWQVLRLSSATVQVDVVPGKGGDILAVRWRPTGVNVLWESPWGLREKGSAGTGGDSLPTVIEQYPGGWQTVFPNGGDPVEQHDVMWGFHGEAWLAPWDFSDGAADDDGVVIELHTRLVRSPFRLRKQIALRHSSVTVTESVTNEGGLAMEAMWSHHPAFGAPFLSETCRVETAAATFVADDLRNTPTGDLKIGSRSSWPEAEGKDGPVNLGRVPGPGAEIDRFGYLTDFANGFAAITNPDLGLRAELQWDAETFPTAWYWLEANAADGFPWFKGVYVFAIEPAAAWPGQGIDNVRTKTGTQLRFEPGETKVATVSLTLQGQRN